MRGVQSARMLTTVTEKMPRDYDVLIAEMAKLWVVRRSIDSR
jgi:hypothetical protein